MLREIRSTLGPGGQGPDVANLQEALIALGDSGWFLSSDPPNLYEPAPPPGGPTLQPTADQLSQFLKVVADRRRFQTYESATETVVAWFQAQAGLADTPGVVEGATAKRLNLELRERRLFTEGVQHCIAGQVRQRPSGVPLVDMLVRASLLTGRDTLPLGDTYTDDIGAYAIPIDAANLIAAVLPGADLPILLQVVDAQDKSIAETQHNAPFDAALIRIDVEVGVAGGEGENVERPVSPVAPTPSSWDVEGVEDRFLDEVSADYVVKGTITDSSGQPQAGLQVVAFDRDLRRHQRLGVASTDAEGHYDIRYHLKDFRRGEGKTRFGADLFVVVLPDDREEPLATSEIRFNAKPEEIIDLVVPALDDGPCEFERVTALVLPLLEGQGTPSEMLHLAAAHKPTDLQPHELNAEDIEFIVRETGLEWAAVQAWAESARWHQEALRILGNDAAPPYGEMLKSLGWQFFYGLCRQLGLSRFSGLLSCSYESLKRAVDAAYKHQIPEMEANDAEVLLKSLEMLRKLQQLDPSRIDAHPIAQPISLFDLNVSNTLKLAALNALEQSITGSPSALQSLHSEFPDETKSINRLVQTMRLQQLAEGKPELMRILDNRLCKEDATLVSLSDLSLSDWQIVAELSNTDAPKALTMLNQIERSHPVETIQARIKGGKLTLPEKVADGIQQLIEKDPGTVSNHINGRMPIPNTKEDTTEDHLSSLGLYGRLGLPFELGSDLISAGITTPEGLKKHDKRTIIKLLGIKHDPKSITSLVNVVLDKVDAAKVIGTEFVLGTVFQTVPEGWYIKPPGPTPEVLENLPSIPALMGDLDECICDPCESMLGQPAYLVDLMQLLAKRNDTDKSPLDYLRKRRHDIFTLALSCETTKTEVQHIDLAIQILEDQLRPQESIDDREVGVAKVYKKLAHEPYPWTMPFDKSHEVKSRYLSKLGITEMALSELANVTLSAEHNAACVLGIPYWRTASNPSTEWKLLSEVSQGEALWKLYGFTPNQQGNVSLIDPASREKLTNKPIAEVLTRISVLLDRTGLSLDEFEEVIRLPYVGHLVIDKREQCKTSQMSLNTGVRSLPDCLDRIHRIVRLQRRSSWSFSEVDAALTGLLQSSNLNDAIATVAFIKDMADTYKIPVKLFLTFQQSIDALLSMLGLSRAQYQCLKALSGINIEREPTDWQQLKRFLEFRQLVEDTKWNIEELAALVMDRQEYSTLSSSVPSFIMSELGITNQIEELKKTIDNESTKLKESDASRVSLKDDESATVVANVLNVAESEVLIYIEWDTGNNKKIKDILIDSSTIEANATTFANWIDRINRLEFLKSKLDSMLFNALLKSIDWTNIIASTSTTQYAAIKGLLSWLVLSQVDQLGSLTSANLLRLEARNEASSTKYSNLVTELSKRLDMSPVEVKELAELQSFTDNTTNKFRDGELVRSLLSLLSFAKQWRSTANQISGLLTNRSPLVAEELLRRKYDFSPSKWLEVKREIENPIRQLRRNALVATLINQSDSRFQNANDIYEHYLIDPLVEPCMVTTKILEAISAVQLYAQRVLYGLETYIDQGHEYPLCASQELKTQWSWMRNYRVWEANRRVYLFPENWLYPELRDDKSSSFELLESELGKGELNETVVEEAFGRFLDDVAQMGHVQVLGMYEDVSLNPDGTYELLNGVPRRRVLYVIGRTANSPYQYYWRKCIDFGSSFMEWAPWQRIELDIQGDHVMPFLLNGALVIAWPVISFIESSGSKSSGWEIKLAFSRFSGNSWGRVSLSRDPITVKDVAFSNPVWGFAFRYIGSQDGDEALIKIFTLKLVPNAKALSEGLPPSTSSDKAVVLTNPVYATGLDVALAEANALAELKSIVRGNYTHLNDSLKKQIKIYSGIKDQWNSTHPLLDAMLKRDAFQSDRMIAFTKPEDVIAAYNSRRGDYSDISSLPDPPSWRIDSFVQDFFSTTKFTYGLDDHRDFTYFNKFFEDLKAECSVLKLTCEAWIHLNTPSTTTQVLTSGYLKLDGSIGQISFSVDGVSVSLNLSNPDPIPLSWHVNNIVSESCEASFTLVDQSTQTSVTLKNVQPLARRKLGEAVTNHVVFCFDATSYNAEDIGFNLSDIRQLTLAPSAFKISSGERISVFPVTTTEQLTAPIVRTQPLLNGYQEITSNSESELSIAGISAFKSPAGTKFNLIPAFSTPSNRAITLWHYSEGDNSRYLDITRSATQSDSGLLVYADSYVESVQRRAAWERTRSLDDSTLQSCRFEADSSPVVMQGLVTSDWLKLKQGELSYDHRLPYACYNWEVFLHAPILIADRLTKQQQFQVADQWLRYVFDPTSTDPGSDASRFLKFSEFKKLDTNDQVINDLKAIAQAAAGYHTEADVRTIDKIIQRWRQLPFRPFVIARGRPIIAFLWQALFAYVDNLIAWADSLYRRDTREANNEALMLYVLAYRILGRRPKETIGASKKPAYTYDTISDKLDQFSNYWVDVASRSDGFAFPIGIRTHELTNKQPPTSIGALLFCMPHNPKLDRYWDVIEDRLFNLRHCRNIEGNQRILPLWDPPIDPEFLVRATAAGLDLGSVIAGLFAAPPHYRYSVLSARATELIAEAKSLGAALLSALEKNDAEMLALIRSTNEVSLLKRVGELRQLQVKEAEANLRALRASRVSTEARYNQYQRLLGLDGTAPIEGSSIGDVAMLGEIDNGSASPRSGLGLIAEECQQYVGIEGASTWSTAATLAKVAGSGFHLTASIIAATPIGINTSGGPSNAVKIPEAVGIASSLAGDHFAFVSQGWRTYAEQQGMLAGHLRRRDEWAFQSNQVLKELNQIDKQILANQIRIEITKKELDNHQLQLEQSAALDEMMRSKFTNRQLYEWMSKELYGLYNNVYRMALEMSRKAETAAEIELGRKKGSLTMINNNYWSSMKQGLLAGERLHLDIKRLEIAYLEQNKREFELTKHVSLRLLNPEALVNLQAKGTVEFSIPEWLFDMDAPGQIMRRIKSISVSIPCVVGPYASVNCKLTLGKNEIRRDNTPSTQYQRINDDDPRFTINFGGTQSIITSTGRDDSGLFETALRDERYLPFEYAGAISSWRLELPSKPMQFDFNTINDVILHIRYTAREGGERLKQSAIEQFLPPSSPPKLPVPKDGYPYPVLLSCRSEFANEWAVATASSTEHLKIKLNSALLPYWMQSLDLKILRVSSFQCPIKRKQSDPIIFVERYTTDINQTTTPPLPSNGEMDLGTVSSALIEDVLILLNVGY